MRYQGKLKKWNDERGFGFIVADDGGQDIFVHVSAFPRDGTPPADGELLSFEVQPDRDGKRKAVRVSRPATQPLAHAHSPAYAPSTRAAPHTPKRMSRTRKESGLGSKLILLLILAALGWYGYSHYASRAARLRAQPANPSAQFNAPPPVAAPARATTGVIEPMPLPVPVPVPMSTPANFQCDSRKYCSQMTSCTEAKLFLRNCPGVQMDGDGDGVPCEEQWCTGPLAK